jgi:hypothetical protein
MSVDNKKQLIMRFNDIMQKRLKTSMYSKTVLPSPPPLCNQSLNKAIFFIICNYLTRFLHDFN